MNITVEIKNVYGVERIYPVCTKAKLLCALSYNKTFNRDDIKKIKLLGYKIINQTESL
jgi:hypothetical protein